MTMSKSPDEKLPTLPINLDKSRKVPENPNELIKEREFFSQ